MNTNIAPNLLLPQQGAEEGRTDWVFPGFANNTADQP